MNIETGVVGVICTFLGGVIAKIIEYKNKRDDRTIPDQEFLFSKYRQLIDDLEEKLKAIELRVNVVQSEYGLVREENIQMKLECKLLRGEADSYKDRCQILTSELNALKKVTT